MGDWPRRHWRLIAVLAAVLAIVSLPSAVIFRYWRVDHFTTEIRHRGCFVMGDLQYVSIPKTMTADELCATLALIRSVNRPLTLRLVSCHITNDVVDLIGRMESIETLDLSATNITDAQIAGLSRMRNLRWLRLSDTKVSDAALPVLKKMIGMETLVLGGSRVTEEKVRSELVNLPKLNLEATIMGIRNRKAGAETPREIRRAEPRSGHTSLTENRATSI